MKDGPRVGFSFRIYQNPKTGELTYVQRSHDEPGPFPPLVAPPESSEAKDTGPEDPEPDKGGKPS